MAASPPTDRRSGVLHACHDTEVFVPSMVIFLRMAHYLLLNTDEMKALLLISAGFRHKLVDFSESTTCPLSH